jgi:prepilin-type N-terminal cleavage/methylation domain-containing protein
MTRPRGFTLVELMIVVAIISVLAVVAGTAYRKYMDAGRKSEVYALMGEFRAKEEAYRAEYNTYLGTGTDEVADLYPKLLGKGKEPSPKVVAPLPALWGQLGINPGRQQLYCGYVAIIGNPNVAPAGANGSALLAPPPTNTPPTVAWWYVNAQCDNDSDGNSAHNANFTTGSTSNVVVTQNEHW